MTTLLRSMPWEFSSDNSQRGKLEQLVITYLKAARYLATCGRFSENKFSEVEKILSGHPWYRIDPRRIQEIKYQVPNLIITDTGLTGWDHVKILEHRSLSEAVLSFLETLSEDFSDVRMRSFGQKVHSEMQEIVQLIGDTIDQ